MDAPVPLILLALLAGAALAAPHRRGRAYAMLGALALTPVLLVAHVWDTSALRPLRDRPAMAVVLGVAGLVVVAALALGFARRPAVLSLVLVALVPFRIPIAVGGTTANLLLPLYVAIGAGVLALALGELGTARFAPPPAGDGSAEEGPAREPGWLERLLALTVVLYALQAVGSPDFAHALENELFFYVPFALLFLLLVRVPWTARRCAQALGVLVGLSLVFAAIGFVEYGTRHLLLNPKVIASNQFDSYFRVNSLFFDPNIYGRFLALVMIGVTAVVLWTRARRVGLGGAAVLAVLWAALLVTYSQSSFAALLLGLAVLGALRWSVRGALALGLAAVAVGAVVVVAAPGLVRAQVGDSKSADAATSGRYDLLRGGVRLAIDKPVLGQGSGAFAVEYRRREQASGGRAVSASHTIPVTVAAEQGVLGLAVYLALLGVALVTLLRGASGSVRRAAVAAAFCGLVLHTYLYAAFLEDPLTWVLLGVGAALARRPGAPT